MNGMYILCNTIKGKDNECASLLQDLLGSFKQTSGLVPVATRARNTLERVWTSKHTPKAEQNLCNKLLTKGKTKAGKGQNQCWFRE